MQSVIEQIYFVRFWELPNKHLFVKHFSEKSQWKFFGIIKSSNDLNKFFKNFTNSKNTKGNEKDCKN